MSASIQTTQPLGHMWRDLVKFWLGLTEPSPAIRDLAERRKARLLSIFLLSLFVLFFLVNLVYALVVPEYRLPLSDLVGYFILGAAFILSRTRYTWFASLILMAMFPLNVFSNILAGTTNEPVITLIFLLPGVILASIFFSAGGILIYGMFLFLMISQLPRLAPQVITNPTAIVGMMAILIISTVLCMIAMLNRDLVERDRRNQLSDSEERFRSFVEQSSDGLVLTDEQGKVIEWNAAQERLSGYTRQEVIDMNIWDLQLRFLPPERQTPVYYESILKVTRTALETGQANFLNHPQEIEILRKDGSKVYLQQIIYPIRTEKGFRIASTNRDISERKQAEAEREKLIRELEDRNSQLERFAYTVSHDLKAPLVTIRGFMGFLEKDALAGRQEKMKTDIERISSATEKMQRLLDDLLELSRIGRITYPPQKLPFNTVVDEAIEMVRGRIQSREAQVIVEQDLPVVFGDRTRLVEIVQNLVDNAIKFMGDQPAPRVEIGLSGYTEDAKPVFFVRDNGIGIPQKYYERIFGLFDKLDPTSQGTGIGLALVKRIVEVHGGAVWVDSQGEGQGATFCFSLPPAPNLAEEG